MQARHRPVAGLLACVALVAAVLLVRQDATPPLPAPGPVPAPDVALPTAAPTPEGSSSPEAADLVGVFAELSDVGPLGRRISDGPVGDVADPDGRATVGLGCRALRPAGPGSPVRGWAVSGQVASVALLREGSGGEPLPLAVWLPPDVVDLLRRTAGSPGAVGSRQPVSRVDLDVVVQLVTVQVPGGELLLSDLGRPGGFRWAELRSPAARPCALAQDTARVIGGGPGPTVDGRRWQGVPLGAAVTDLVDDGRLAGLDAAAATATGCRSWPVGQGGPPGLRSVLVEDGVLLAVGLDGGAFRAGTAPALPVGAAPAAVRAAFADRVGVGELQALRDNSGLVVPLPPADGGGPATRAGEARRVVVSTGVPSAVVEDVDVPVTGPAVVSSLLVGLACAGG